MPAYNRQLKDEDDNIIYPITTAENVVDTDGVDLQTRVDTGVYLGTGSVGSPSPWVDTSDIIDGTVTADKIDFSTMPGNYSLTEVNTGYTWIDGSPIYKKTISISSMPNATYAQHAHNITGITQVIDASFIMANSTNTNFWVCPYTSVNLLEITPTMLNIQSSLDLRAYSAYVTLYYTKLS